MCVCVMLYLIVILGSIGLNWMGVGSFGLSCILFCCSALFCVCVCILFCVVLCHVGLTLVGCDMVGMFGFGVGWAILHFLSACLYFLL